MQADARGLKEAVLVAQEQFGPYQLEELIGRGGMGEVFRAFDTVRKRTVALKRLPLRLGADPTFQARFRRESELAARLSEPHIIPIHDYGEIDGQLFIDMPLVSGIDLGDLLERDRARRGQRGRHRLAGGDGSGRGTRSRPRAPGRQAVQHPDRAGFAR